ncbi:response regulator transcription factor [Streptomyces sp. NPDC093085]|uniref:response regulator transcription factor n=1 Tax=Streptomyces sp. NPDC093085 TaxID=3155068 RepID=UPI00343BB4FC
MPDDPSRTSGQQPTPRHASQYTSAHDGAPHSPLPSMPLPAPPPPGEHPGLPDFPGPAAPVPLRVVVADDNPVVRAGLTVLLSGRDDIEVVGEAADGRQAYEVAQRTSPDVVLLDVRMPGVDGISALPHLVRISPVMMLTYSRENEIVHEALRLGAGGYLVHGEFTADQLVSAVRDIKQGRAHFTPTAANALLEHMRSGPSPLQDRPLPEGLGAVYTTGVPYGGEAQPAAPIRPPEPDANAHANAPGVPSPRGPQTGQRPGGLLPEVPRIPQGVSQMQSDVAQSRGGPQGAPGHNREEFGLSSREVEIMDLIASGMSNQQIAATCFISEKTVKNHINRIFAKLHSGSRSEAIAKWLGTTPGGGAGRSAVGHG